MINNFRWIIAGNNVISMKVDFENKEGEKQFEFEAGEVYAVDLAFSTGEGKNSLFIFILNTCFFYLFTCIDYVNGFLFKRHQKEKDIIFFFAQSRGLILAYKLIGLLSRP